MVRILPFSIAAGFIAVALAVLVVLVLTRDAVAQTEQGSLSCVDSNNNGKVDIAELFDVIDLYFSGDQISVPAPAPTHDGTTRSKAFPYGEEFEAGILNMQITVVDTDAWPEIQAENQFNDPPAEGYRFMMWTLEVENARGSTDEYEWVSDISFGLVGSENVLYYPFSEDNRCGVIPDGLGERLYLGGTGTGNICLSVPVDETNFTFLYDTYHDDANGESISVEVWFDATDWR